MSKNDEIQHGKARHRFGVREVRLRHFVSRNVVTALDDGCDDRGAPNQQRQHLLNTLKKRVRFAGVEVPTFVLAEPPGPWPEARSDKERMLRAGDRFDFDVLKHMDGSGWRLPTERWLELSDKAFAAEQERAKEQAERGRASRAAKGLEAIDLLRRLAGDAPAAPPPPAAPPVAAKGARP